MSNIVPPKGTHDVIGNEGLKYDHIENIFRSIARFYGFLPLRTPIFEATELFQRSVGDGSDIVRKEMYTFIDKGNRSMTLRPEMTAGIMRSIVSNKLYATEDWPLKYYYIGQTFRYERPQKGRFREFNQLGIESVGIASIFSHVETIILGVKFLQALGLQDVTLKINTLGDQKSRDDYRLALKEFFTPHIGDMCSDCQVRHQINPLRILDCKVTGDHEIVKNAPKMSDYLTEEARSEFDQIVNILTAFNIKYQIDESLVRGLDYYSHVVFEFHYTSSKGVDYGAIGAGGHYEHLIEEIGGPAMPGIGWAFGLERLYAVLSDDGLLDGIGEATEFYVMSVGQYSAPDAFTLLIALRESGFTAEMTFEDKSFKQLFKRAGRKNAAYAMIIGDDEVEKEQVTIKNLITEEQFSVKYEDVIDKACDLIDEQHDHHHDHDHDHDHEEE